MFVKTVLPVLLIAGVLGGAIGLQSLLVSRRGETRGEGARRAARGPFRELRLQLIAGGDLPRLRIPSTKQPPEEGEPAPDPGRPAGEDRLAVRDRQADTPPARDAERDAGIDSEEDAEVEVMVRAGSRSVTMRRGDTVYGICKRMLGSSRRWNDVLALNGWTPDEARKLKVGTKVRLY